MHWLHPTAANMEFGLREMKTDSDVNQLRISMVENGCVDFQIYFEHPVLVPIIAEGVEAVPGGDGCVNLDSDGEGGSSSHDSYESAEDEAYKPPLDGYESSSDTNDGKSKKVNKRGTRTKKIMTPTKKGSPKKTVRSTPTRRSSRNRVFGNQDKDAAKEVVMDSGKENNAEEDVGKKKKASRKYTGK
ncbi:hypothetical protein PIB30_113924, partial [Stylosanthes scabra]|nr:hypothetical protein [Stylosanthes scabra]